MRLRCAIEQWSRPFRPLYYVECIILLSAVNDKINIVTTFPVAVSMTRRLFHSYDEEISNKEKNKATRPIKILHSTRYETT